MEVNFERWTGREAAASGTPFHFHCKNIAINRIRRQGGRDGSAGRWITCSESTLRCGGPCSRHSAAVLSLLELGHGALLLNGKVAARNKRGMTCVNSFCKIWLKITALIWPLPLRENDSISWEIMPLEEWEKIVVDFFFFLKGVKS